MNALVKDAMILAVRTFWVSPYYTEQKLGSKSSEARESTAQLQNLNKLLKGAQPVLTLSF